MSLPLRLIGYLTRSDVPDLTGKVAVVTGFNSGIGYETTRSLLDHNAEVIGVTRSQEHAAEAVSDLQREFPGSSIRALVHNMESMSEVRLLADEILATGKNINLLINNAGRFIDAPFGVTKEGFEQTIALDYFGHALLTLLLLENMMSNGSSRVVNVVSIAEMFGSIDWADLKGGAIHTSGTPAYGRAKLMFLMFTYELQRRLRLMGAPVEAFAVHPGVVATRLMDKVNFRYPFAVVTYLMSMVMGQTPSLGAQSTLYAATNPQLTGKGGQFIGPNYNLNFFNCYARKPRNPQAYDVDARKRLWEETIRILEETTGRQVPTLPATGTRV
jgi:NAD(P)-dependent dehydrogenase (short-subunit alcohol dehydrogenase family)